MFGSARHVGVVLSLLSGWMIGSGSRNVGVTAILATPFWLSLAPSSSVTSLLCCSYQGFLYGAVNVNNYPGEPVRRSSEDRYRFHGMRLGGFVGRVRGVDDRAGLLPRISA